MGKYKGIIISLAVGYFFYSLSKGTASTTTQQYVATPGPVTLVDPTAAGYNG